MERTKENLVRHAIRLPIDKNAIVKEGEDTLLFPNGLVLTDTSTMWDGMRYDINSLDISQYNRRVFADHNYDLENIVGTMINVYKLGDKVLTDGIQFASSEMGRLAKTLVLEGHLDTVSIGTIGPMADENNIYRNHILIDTSWVGIPNNKNATINEKDVIPLTELAVRCGLNIESIRKENMKEEKTEAPVDETEAPEGGTPVDETASVLNELKSELAELKKFRIEHSKEAAKETPFVAAGEAKEVAIPAVTTGVNKFEQMSGKERTKRQAKLAFDRMTGSEEFIALNEVNKKELISKKSELEAITKNVITMREDSFGGFIPCYELLAEIVGCRTNYDSLLEFFSFEQSENLQYAWNLRVGDIDMKPVDKRNDGDDGNRKPISEYGLNLETRSMEELAAVTPVCNAATLFAVGDLLRDIATGYQNDNRRKFAQLVVAEMQKAVDLAVAGKTAGGADIAPRPNASVSVTSTEEWDGILSAINSIVDCTPNGVLVMSSASYGVLQAALIRAGFIGGGNTDLITADGARFNSYLGRRVIVVPNDLLPTLGTNETRTFVVGGTTVEIDHAIFYLDSMNWRGVTFGGLAYDLSREAAYEVNIGTDQSPNWVTRSAFQRNELVLRGSMFRGGGVKDFRQITGILAETAESA